DQRLDEAQHVRHVRSRGIGGAPAFAPAGPEIFRGWLRRHGRCQSWIIPASQDLFGRAFEIAPHNGVPRIGKEMILQKVGNNQQKLASVRLSLPDIFFLGTINGDMT
ncbi:hypothetical protein, partial [Methylobacterium trifolii]|uniref:hypothetical protein n=1 Tax=Methylobacterium trifolii TaxID=1003092 RepID=UPI001EDDFA50